MATLDSPIEALAFEYVSFGVFAVVNNVWTWIAVVTAAVSFWRIRVTTTTNIVESHARGEIHASGLLKEPTRKEEFKTVAPVKETVAFVAPLMCDDGVTKGKMTLYYEVGVNGGECVDGELTDVNYDGGLGDCGEWWEKWERVIKVRNGDEGWYRYVDLTVINGNVVRLWDDNGVRNGGKCLN